MKKRLRIMLFLVMSMLVFMVGCESEQPEGTKIDISYINKSETRIINEPHYLSSLSTKDMIVEVLTLLSTVPDSKEAKAVIGGNVNIVKFTFEGSQIILSLGEKYKELSKTTEVLTRAAIVKSLTQIPEVEYVMLTINGEPIQDAAGNAIGIIGADTFVDNAGEQMGDYELVTIRLYFANETGDGLIPIKRELAHNINTSNTSMEKLVVEQLIKGPANSESYPTINPNTKLLGVTVKDGICYVNLDSSVIVPAGNETTDITIYSITNSLVELSNINKVQISIDGKTDVLFRDKYNLTTIFERNLDYIQ